MKRKKLLEMGSMEAADEMMQAASKDIPKERQFYKEKEVYEYGTYVCARTRGDLMAVSLFYTENMRLGARKPVYIIFIDRAKEEFLTYDFQYEKWREATLDRINEPISAFYSGIHIHDNDREKIREFLHAEKGELDDIKKYQYQIRKKQLLKRYKRETEPWDKLMEEIPPYPKDWKRWVAKSAITSHFIFYRYQKHVKEGYCSWCEMRVPITAPRHNQEGRCPRCRHKIKYKAIGRAGQIWTQKENAYLLQPLGNRMVIREFRVCSHYEKGDYKKPKSEAWEIRRVILDGKLQAQVFFYGLYKQQYHRWIKNTGEWSYQGFLSYYNYFAGQIYRRIISQQELEQVLSMIKPCKQFPVVKVPRNIFRGKLRCGYCKRLLRVRDDHRKMQAYCYTLNWSDETDCYKHSFYLSEVESVILALVKQQAALADDTLKKMKGLSKTLDDSKLKKELEKYEAKLRQIDQNKMDLYEQYVSGEITKEKFIEEKKRLTQEESSHKEKEESLWERIKQVDAGKKKISSPILQGFAKYIDLDALSYPIVQELIDVIYFYNPERLEVVWKYRDEFQKILDITGQECTGLCNKKNKAGDEK